MRHPYIKNHSRGRKEFTSELCPAYPITAKLQDDKMATTTRSQRECFKSFLKKRKAEYRSQFPFLTESQVAAKLKRLWNSQQARETLTADNCEFLISFA